MQKKLAIWLSALAFVGTGATAVQAQVACEPYQVKRGDTLRNIARAAYGEPVIDRLYRENRRAIGRNPNVLRVGVQLVLPCSADGTKSPGTAPSTAAAYSLVTANGLAPYSDEALLGRGLITHVVEKAFMRADPEAKTEILFVNDWAAHVESLLPRQAFDASFPWPKPGCETQGQLTSEELFACQNYVYSDPIYDSVEGFFALAGSGYEDAQSVDLLKGATICRADGMATGHLEMAQLMPPNATLVQPDSYADCFDKLALGEVDIVAIDTRAGELLAAKIGMDFTAIENPFLHMIEPLYAAVHKDNPKSAELIRTLNEGLAVMRETGEWNSLVSDGLRQPTEVIMN